MKKIDFEIATSLRARDDILSVIARSPDSIYSTGTTKQSRFYLLTFVLFTFYFLLFTQLASAYLPPPERVLAKSLKTMPGGTFIEGRGSLEFFPPDPSSAGTIISLRFFLAIPNQVKFEFFAPSYPAGLTLVVIKNNLILSSKNSEIAGVVGQDLLSLFPALFSPFISEGIKALKSSLETQGINTDQVGLDHFEREIVYQIGNPETARPGFWVSKDNYFPRRLVLSREKPVRVDYLKYRFLDNGSAIPKEIELYSGEKPWVTIRFDSVQLIPEFPPGFFSLK